MSSSSRRGGRPLLETSTIIATSLLVAIISIQRAVTCGLLPDELLFVHAIELGVPASLMAPGSSHPPLVRLLVGAIADPEAAPDWLLRLPSLCFSVGCVIVWHRVLLRMIDQSVVRSLLLFVIALNPFWMQQSFQCLPYPALTFLTSLYCLSWLRFVEDQGVNNSLLLILTGSLLPWVHFFGINTLIASQLLWAVLLCKQFVTLRKFVLINFSTLVLTLPVVPFALFYILHDSPFPLAQVRHFPSYFLNFSALYFSMVTFPGWKTTWPLFAVLYIASGVFLWQQIRRRWPATDSVASGSSVLNKPVLNDCYRLIGIMVLLAGFTAVQLHSLVSHAAMWPRYLLGGAWIHLPLMIALLEGSRRFKIVWLLSAVVAIMSVVAVLQMPTEFRNGTDYPQISAHLKNESQPGDAFLAQSMDLWDRDNHFDRLWWQRYTNETLPVVSGPNQRRATLARSGLNLRYIDSEIERLWVYSHLFKQDWHRSQKIAGWRLIELNDFGGPFPLALYERESQRSNPVHKDRMELTSDENRSGGLN